MFFSPVIIPNPSGSLQYITRTSDTGISGGTSTTFSGSQLSLGAPNTDRRIFLGIAWRGTDTAGRTLSSISIDPAGVVGSTALTIHGQVGFGEATTGNYGVALASAIIATGATGSIAASFSGAVDEAQVVIYRRVGLINSTPFDSVTDELESSQGSLSGLINTAAGGILLGVYAQGNILGTPAWTAGLTEDDRFQSTSNQLEVLIGSVDRTAAATNATVSSSTSSSTSSVGCGFVAVSWR